MSSGDDACVEGCMLRIDHERFADQVGQVSRFRSLKDSAVVGSQRLPVSSIG